MNIYKVLNRIYGGNVMFYVNYFYLIIFLSIVTSAIAQKQFVDNFDLENKGWWYGEEGTFLSKIESGKLVLDFKAENSYKVNWQPIKINYEKDFTISADFNQLSGTDNHGYGFVWASKDISNLYYFIISSNGQASIYKKEEGNWIEIRKWTPFKAIKPMNKLNKIVLTQTNKKLKILVNDEIYYDSTGFKPFGEQFGFVLNNTMKIEVDNLSIDYLEPKILLVDNPVQNSSRENLGNKINSKYGEVTPIISSDGNEIYFTRKNDPDNIGSGHYDDIFYSKKNNDGTWNLATRLGFPLNNESANSVISLSSDGNSVLLMNQYTSDGKGVKGGGISKSYKTTNGWSIPEDINIIDYYNKHRYSWENQFLSSDNKILLLSAQRDDSYGDLDIYVSFWENEKYTKPINLGPVVNSFSIDYSPFLAADGKTLYFTSSGHTGYGSDDVFMTRRLDDTWTNWSEPKNLGNGINTEMGDAYFVIPASGEYAYMTTTQNSIGGNDIIKIKLNKESKPDPVVLVYGKVLDSKNNKPIGTSIKINNLTSNKELAIANSDPNTGDYKIILPYGELYSFMAEKNQYYSISENMDLKSYSSYKEIEKNLYLTPIEKGTIFRLNNVFFDFDKSELRSESFAELNRLLGYLNSNSNLKIEISGHTDNQGTYDYNNKLSNNRAISVKNYLIKNGINSNRLSSKGYGALQPVASNDTEEGRQYNRRVEVKILEK